MWIQWKLFDKIEENLHLDLFRGTEGPTNLAFRMPIVLHTSTSSPLSLQLKFHVNQVETFQENNGKPKFWLIWAWQKGPENMSEGHHLHTPESSPDICL